MELTCPNWDPSIYDFSHGDVAIEDNTEDPTRNALRYAHPHPVEHEFNYIEPYMSEGYDLESLRTSSSDSTIQVVRTNFDRSVLPLIRHYGTQAIEECSLISYHFDFEEGVPSSLWSWILYCIKNGKFVQSVPKIFHTSI